LEVLSQWRCPVALEGEGVMMTIRDQAQPRFRSLTVRMPVAAMGVEEAAGKTMARRPAEMSAECPAAATAMQRQRLVVAVVGAPLSLDWGGMVLTPHRTAARQAVLAPDVAQAAGVAAGQMATIMAVIAALVATAAPAL